MNVNYFTFIREDFICPYCGWKGKGAELTNGDFSEDHLICDLDCPSCYEHLGFWQAPLLEEKEKWEKDNPGIDTGR